MTRVVTRKFWKRVCKANILYNQQSEQAGTEYQLFRGGLRIRSRRAMYIFGLTRGGLSARFGRVIFEGPSAPIDCNIIGPPSTILNSGIKSILKNFVLNIDSHDSIV